MIACDIKIENGIPVVNKYPRLMQDILVYTGFNINQSLDLYGIAIGDEFENLNIENPSLQNVLAFTEQLNIENSTELSKKDRENLLNISLQKNYIEDIKSLFLDTFDVNGNFGIQIDKVRDSGLFSDSDILEMNDADTINGLKSLYYKLTNTDETFEGISSDIVIKNNIFSKMNPDEFLQNIYDNYIGLDKTKDVLDKANLISDETVLNNINLVHLIIENVKNKKSFVQYETDEYNGDVVKKTINDPMTRMEQTLDLNQDFEPFRFKLEMMREIPIEDYVYNLPAVSQFINSLENDASKLGIDIKGLSDLMETKTYTEISDFADSLYNFITDVSVSNSSENIQESLEDYVNSYTSFFNVQPIYKNSIGDNIDKRGIYLHLETNQNEEELFKNYSVLKVGNNIYQKITDNKTIEELYNLIFQNPALVPRDVFSVSLKPINNDILLEEIDQYISNLSKQYLTESSDIESIKKITLYKLLNNVEDSRNEKVLNGIFQMDVNNFLIKFNKLILSNDKLSNLFYFSNRGLEANRIIGQYSAMDIKNEISTSDFDNLVNYSKLSGNESLEYFTNFNNELSSDNLRDYYANNLSQLPVNEKNYYKDNGYVVIDSNEDFLNIKNNLYERVAPNIYDIVNRDMRYMNYNLSRPEYDNSIIPDIKSKEDGNIKIKKTKQINNNTIEFC